MIHSVYPDSSDNSLRLITDVATEVITLARAKSWLRLEHDLDDDEVTELIKSAREFGESITRTAFALKTYRYTLNEYPCGPVALPYPPLRSVTSVKYKDAIGDWTTYSGHEVDTDAIPGMIYPGVNGWNFPSSTSSLYTSGLFQVDFTCGYGTNHPLPKPLIDAMLQYITWGYEEKLPTGKEPSWLVKMFRMYRVA